MESTHHVITIENEEIAREEERKRFSLPFPPIISRLRENKIHCSLVPISCYLKDKKKSDDQTRKIIHSIKVGISLVLVSLLYLVDPLYEQVGENAMWAIMTVVVIFEFSAGATLGKGLNRGMGTTFGGVLGCLTAFLAQKVGGFGNSIIIGTSVFIFGTVATYFRMVPSIKKRYDYGVTIFMLTFNLVVVSGVRAEEVLQIARERLLTILMGFIVVISVNLFIFPYWTSDELHQSTFSKFHDLANTLQGCVEESFNFVSEKENQPATTVSFTACKSVLNSKSKDESLANFAKWEPWHGKFGLSYPWEKYLKIGEALRELAVIILSLGSCVQSSRQSMASQRESVQESCEAIGSSIVWAIRELGDSIKQTRKCQAESQILPKLKAVRVELSLVISNSKLAALENGDALAIASFVFLLTEVLQKVEELAKEVDELGKVAGFHSH